MPENKKNTQDYVLYAEDIMTKTATDASFNVNWVEGDNLAVYTWTDGTDLPTDAAVWRSANPVNFVAEPGEATPRPFGLSETDDVNSLAETSYSDRLMAFRTRFGDGASSLNWGVIYPGKMSNASRPGMGIVVFGDGTKVRSRQNGNDNMDHLAYQDVLWGTATGTAPTIGMKHLGTMMVYTVNNASSTEFTVTSIKIVVNGANIGGEFRFNVFGGSFDSCMTPLHECTLWVENGSAIPAGGLAKFYQVLAPFALSAGKKITMTVETDKGSWSKEMMLDSDKTFESGKKNNVILPVKITQVAPQVEIRNNKLLVNGTEFFVKGVAVNGDNKDSDGKQEFWKEAKASGANVVRIYGANSQAKEMLDEMARNGLYVCFGLNVGRQCNGFDYDDIVARQNQIAELKNIVNNLKGHPAILMWCIGNELEGEVGGLQNVNNNVWDDINEISKYIHENDSRPTTVAICWPWNIIAKVPDIDFISINQYSPDVYNVHNAINSLGVNKPYVISEFGPRGTWDKNVPTTEWGGLIEDSGTKKSKEYRKIYNECVLAHKNEGCLGSFVFLWGYQSHGAVQTWYAMYDQFHKYSLPSVDVMTELWSGIAVSNHAPVIEGYECLTVNGMTADQSVKLKRGGIAEAIVVASDSDDDAVTYSWKIIEDKRLSAGTLMPNNPISVIGDVGNIIKFKVPEKSGSYRLIVWAEDVANNKADMASFPFYVTDAPYSHYDDINRWDDGNSLNF